ncbi:MAG: anti-sigma-I factor RsgI family protein [Clostridia bacterium]
MHKEGVVIKVTDQYIVLLCDDGTFQNVKRAKGQIPLIGERNVIRQRRNAPAYGYLSKISAIACIIAFMIFSPLIFDKMDKSTAYVVAIDINPSIEVQVNKELYTIGLTALNQSGEKIVSTIKYKGKRLEETINLIIAQSVNYGFLNQNKTGLITTSIVPINVNEQIDKDKVKSIIDEALARNEVYAEVQISADGKETMEAAHALGLTVNKYKLYRILVDNGLPISTQEVKENPIKSLLELINKHSISTENTNEVLDNLNQHLENNDVELEESTHLENKPGQSERNNKINNPLKSDSNKNADEKKDEEGIPTDKEKKDESEVEVMDKNLDEVSSEGNGAAGAAESNLMEEKSDESIETNKDTKDVEDSIQDNSSMDSKNPEENVTDSTDRPEKQTNDEKNETDVNGDENE